jgi:uncharacterized membrane protein (UPF0127 family)
MGGLMRRLGFAVVLPAAALVVLVMFRPGVAQPVDPAGPQPALPSETLSITGDDGVVHKFSVELPVTQAQQDTGEMFRTNIPADAGMLFVWQPPQVSNMWMKNCPVPEDMVFIAPDGTIAAIAEMTVPFSTKTITSNIPVAATLELQGGITAKDNINVGDRVVAKQFGGQ